MAMLSTAQLLEEQELFLVLRLDESLRIVAANQQSSRILRGHLLGKPLQDLVLNFSGTLDLNRILSSQGATHLLTLPTVFSIPASFLFRFYPETQGWIALGSLDMAEQIALLERTLELYREQNLEIRRLHQDNQDLKRLRQVSSPSNPYGSPSHRLDG